VLSRKIAEFGRHVALVMLGENRICDKCLTPQPTFRNRAAALAKKVRNDAAVNDRRRNAPSVTTKRIVIPSLSRRIDPFSTIPPGARPAFGRLPGSNVGRRVE
jgi:hypothetical protein